MSLELSTQTPPLPGHLFSSLPVYILSVWHVAYLSRQGVGGGWVWAKLKDSK